MDCKPNIKLTVTKFPKGTLTGEDFLKRGDLLLNQKDGTDSESFDPETDLNDYDQTFIEFENYWTSEEEKAEFYKEDEDTHSLLNMAGPNMTCLDYLEEASMLMDYVELDDYFHNLTEGIHLCKLDIHGYYDSYNREWDETVDWTFFDEDGSSMKKGE